MARLFELSMLLVAVFLFAGCQPADEETTETGSSTGESAAGAGDTGDNSSGTTESGHSSGSGEASRQKNETGEGSTELDGAALAAKHIEANELHLREPPLPYPPWYSCYSALLKERCKVTITVVDRAPLNGDDLAYNEAMMAEIEKRFGKGIVGKCRDDAQKPAPSPP